MTTDARKSRRGTEVVSLEPRKSLAPVTSLGTALVKAGCTRFHAKQLEYLAFEGPEFDYTGSKVQPLGEFLKRLVRGSGKLKLWIPDTIVAEGVGRVLTWYYTNPDGVVCSETGFTSKHVLSRFGNRRDQHARVAVLKVPHPSGKHNKTIMKTTANLQETVEGIVQSAVLQRFIEPAGVHAVVFRCVYSRETGALTRYCLSATPRAHDENVPADERLLVSIRNASPPQVTKMSRKALPELTETMEELRMFLLIHAGTDMEDLVCDFARDSSGHMWLLQVKAFRAKGGDVKTGSFPKGLPLMCPCALCSGRFVREELPFVLSTSALAGIYEALRRMHRPLAERRAAADLRPNTVRICRACFRLYEELLVLQETQTAYYRKLEAVKPPNFFKGEACLPQPVPIGSTVGVPLDEQHGAAHQPMPEDWELPAERLSQAVNIVRVDETLDVEGVTLVRPLRSFHVLLFLRDLANIPARFLGGAQVVFSLLGADYRVPLRVEGKARQGATCRVPVRVFVSRLCFARSLEALSAYARHVRGLEVDLVAADGSRLARSTL